MPSVRKLTPHEVETLEHRGKGQRKLVEEQYDAFLAGYEIGDYGEAELEENENRLTVRNRFKAAAARRGIELIFQRMPGTTMRFKVAPAPAVRVEVPPEPPAVEPEPPVASVRGQRVVVDAGRRLLPLRSRPLRASLDRIDLHSPAA